MVTCFMLGIGGPACVALSVLLSPVEPLSPGSQHCSLGCTAYNYPQSTLKQLSFTVINSLHFKGFMWHQTPRATVCYCKLLLFPLSYLYILKSMTVLTKETVRILRVIVILSCYVLMRAKTLSYMLLTTSKALSVQYKV